MDSSIEYRASNIQVPSVYLHVSLELLVELDTRCVMYEGITVLEVWRIRQEGDSFLIISGRYQVMIENR